MLAAHYRLREAILSGFSGVVLLALFHQQDFGYVSSNPHAGGVFLCVGLIVLVVVSGNAVAVNLIKGTLLRVLALRSAVLILLCLISYLAVTTLFVGEIPNDVNQYDLYLFSRSVAVLMVYAMMAVGIAQIGHVTGREFSGTKALVVKVCAFAVGIIFVLAGFGEFV